MPDTALQDRPATTTGSTEDILHLTCCDDDTALCGEDVSDDEWGDQGKLCVPCEIEWVLNPGCAVAECPRKGNAE